MPRRTSYRQNLKRIRLLLLDVDGVLTDGGIYLSGDGDEMKKFNIRDGYGIAKIQRAGVAVGIITGRTSPLVKRRAEELGIRELHQGVEDKMETYRRLKQKYDLEDASIAYIGDDEPDLDILRIVGFSAAPLDAAEPVRKAVHYVCAVKGGEGAVREVIDLILESRAHGKR
ncbi:MAG: HAD-IIIA family hydrolase [Ignavibacteria bacterium]|nr:HAD-IIIA family hydrolase [Ignavibacteria bacterium]